MTDLDLHDQRHLEAAQGRLELGNHSHFTRLLRLVGTTPKPEILGALASTRIQISFLTNAARK